MLRKLFANLRPHNDTSAEALFGWHTIVDVMGGTDEPYMTRIWFGRLRLHIFHTADPGKDPHDHPWGFWTFPLTSYVEEVTIPIRQAVPEGSPQPQPKFQTTLQVVRAFRWNYRKATHTHRVLGRFTGFLRNPDSYFDHGVAPKTIPAISGERVVTFVWRDAPKRAWGFLRRDDTGQVCWVPWRLYVYFGGNEAPCAEVENEKVRYDAHVRMEQYWQNLKKEGERDGRS